MRVIGMMSGTSFDAVDAAAADIEIVDDTVHLHPLGLISQPYPAALRESLVASLPPATTSMELVCKLDTAIGQAFAELADRANQELCAGTADLVVSHGQTVYHWTEGAEVLGTLQIGQPAWIAEVTGLPVVSDLRARDVTAGGQGAPLVSALDVRWLRGRGCTSVALNLGGIANVTVVSPVREPVAFDTGPANALIDAVVQQATGGRLSYDVDGALGAGGHIRPDLLASLLADPYYRRAAPKSTGKELFNLSYLETALSTVPAIDTPDLVATLTALTARTVADAVLAADAEEMIVAGGGTQNLTLMGMLRANLPDTRVLTADQLGLPAAAKEAYAFAFLGFCTVSGLTSSVPACTGARHASVLGSVTPGRNGLPGFDRVGRQPRRLEIHGVPIST